MPKSYYKKKNTKLITPKTIAIAVIVVLLFIAKFTVPSEMKVRKAVASYVKMDIRGSSADHSYTDEDADRMFYAYNSIDIHQYSLCSVARMHNRYKTQDIMAAIGVFGIVIPLIDWNEYIITNGPVKHHYYHGGMKNPQNTPIIGDKDFDTGKLPDD